MGKASVHAAAWGTRAAELARWALERFFVRTDRCGGFYLSREAGTVKGTTRPAAGPEDGYVTLALLERHFRAQRCDDVVGAHTLAPESGAGRWCALDIDNHDDKPELVEANRAYAESRHLLLAERGFRPLTVGYGKGSFHVVVMLDRNVTGGTLARLAEWCRGEDAKHETFPKQDDVAANKFGNWLRLVGRHKSRDVWARVYDGANWLEGAPAVEYVLALTGDSPDLIPEDIRFPKPKPPAKKPAKKPEQKRTAPDRGEDGSVFERYNREATLDELIEHCKRAGHALLKRDAERADFTRAGKDGGASFNLQVKSGTVLCYNFSSNAGLPAGEALNPSHTRCALKFGKIDTDSLAKTALLLEQELGIRPRPAGKSANRTRGTNEVTADGATSSETPPAAPAWWERPLEGETWTDPHRLARLFVRATASADGIPTLVQWRDEFHAWRCSAYRALGSGDLDAQLAKHARDVFVADLPHRRAEAGAAGSKVVPKLPPVTGRVRADVRTNLAGLTNVPDDGRDAPFWLRGTRDIDPRAVVVAPNGLFTLERIAQGQGPFAAATPDLFTPNVLPFDAPLGECDLPLVWLEKVHEWFGGDAKAKLGLQEWLGYLLSADTAQHKILMLVGPPRSGKGTILRVLSKIAGSANVAATSFAALGESFGLQSLLGKRVAVIPDARLSGRTDTAAVAERLLGVSGDDRQPVNRKNLPMVTTRLNVRFVVATNEIPKLTDASGALASRFHILAMPNTFFGREDKQLDEKLDAELPAILQWAAKGYVRLRTQGAFTQNEAAAQHHRHLEELSSPVRSFVRERCDIGPTFRATLADLFAAWSDWCDDRALSCGAANVFSRDLRAAFGHISDANLRTGEKRTRFLTGIGLRPCDEWGEPATGQTGTGAA